MSGCGCYRLEARQIGAVTIPAHRVIAPVTEHLGAENRRRQET